MGIRNTPSVPEILSGFYLDRVGDRKVVALLGGNEAYLASCAFFGERRDDCRHVWSPTFPGILFTKMIRTPFDIYLFV